MLLPRILMVSTHGYLAAKPQLGKPDTGGQVVYVLELSKALATYGFSVDILTRGFEGQRNVESVAEDVRILRCNYAGSSFLPKEELYRYAPELLQEFLKDGQVHSSGYGLIMSHYWDSGVAAVGLARRLGLSHIYTPHSLGLLKRKNAAWGTVGESTADCLDERIKCERAICHQADLVISTAAEQTSCLRESDEYNVPESMIEQIPAGVDDDLFYPVSSDERALIKEESGWNRPTILCAGRLAVSKGYDLMLLALPAILKRVPGTQLVLAIGSERKTNEELLLLEGLKAVAAKLGISKHVQFLPCVEQSQLATYYRAADVFVLSSRNEPFGMTAIESMACGTPTVVTTRGGLWEETIWGQDCIYCDPLDSDALAQAVCYPLLQTRIREQLARAGAETVVSKYTWKKVARDVLKQAYKRNLLQLDTIASLARP